MRSPWMLLVASLLAPSLAHAGSYLRVVSWNTRHEGWSGETDFLGDADQLWFEFGSTAAASAGCDLIFLQEIMDVTVPASIAAELTRISGKTWASSTTPLVGRSNYKEAYTVLYRTDRVTIVSSQLWKDPLDKYEREPQVVQVRDRSTGADFTFINWHTVFGTTTQRRNEIAEIAKLFADVQAADPRDQDVILLGDHNAAGTSTWWTALKALTPPVTVTVDELTTINAQGAYASAYDHFWFQSKHVVEYSSAGRDYVFDTLQFQQDLSDHAPIWLRLYSNGDTD